MQEWQVQKFFTHKKNHQKPNSRRGLADTEEQDNKMDQQTERERQDFNTQRSKREAGAGNQGDEQEGSEFNSDEDKMNLQNKTGKKVDNRQEGQGHKTKVWNEEETKGACHGRSRPWQEGQ